MTNDHVGALSGAYANTKSTDIETNLPRIIETTRRAWLGTSYDDEIEDENEPAQHSHPLVRFAFDPRRIAVWLARIDRLKSIQQASVELQHQREPKTESVFRARMFVLSLQEPGLF